MILTGEGKAFCAGADLADLMADYETGGPDLASVINERFNPMVRALVDAPVPTIAAVNGVAAGAGLGLALACDLRVMSSQAFFLSAFIGLALIPDTRIDLAAGPSPRPWPSHRVHRHQPANGCRGGRQRSDWRGSSNPTSCWPRQ